MTGILLISYFLIINIVTFVIYGADKRAAIKHSSRISENALLGLALIGGSAGALAGMLNFRHKTKKPLFSIGVPVIMVMQMILIILLIQHFS